MQRASLRPAQAQIFPAAVRVAALLVLAAAYWGGAELGIRLAAANQLVTAVWPPTGIAVIALLMGGNRLWPGIALGAFIAETTSGVPIPFAIGMAVGNTLAPAIAATALCRAHINSALSRVRDVVAFVTIAAATMTISATSGTVFFELAGISQGRPFAQTWTIWWVGDAMGVLLLVPVYLALAGSAWRQLRGRAEAGAFMVLSACVSFFLWQATLPLRHLLIPLAVVAALLFGPRGAAAFAFVTASVAIGTAAWTPRADDFLLLQTVNASVALTSLTLGAVMHERNQKTLALNALASDLDARVQRRTAQLAEANNGLAQAQRIAHIGSFIWDAKHDVVHWTPELYRIHGLDPVHGPPPTTDAYMAMVHEDDCERVQASFLDALRTRQELEHDFRINLRDGTQRWIHAYVAPTHTDDGKLVGLHGASQDITARKLAEEAHRIAEERFAAERHRVEDALRTALERERDATAHLRKLDETKNAILNAVSHELRTPLTAILGFTELLRSPDVRADAEMTDEMLARVDGSAQRLSRLLQDLLDLSRLDHGAMEPQRETRDIRELVDEAVIDLDLSAHPLVLQLEPGTCTVDPTHFERIVQNLVGNAIKYTPAGTPIHISVHRETGGGVTIAIEDEGPGIPADKRRTVFEPFERLSKGAYTQGAGVGLALVDRFAKMHGGRAWAAERDGGGAAFRVHLPGSSAAA